jgi:Reverse transcriptase (RNA-dependent DNA polymerase)
MQLKPGCKPVRESLRPHPEQYERATEQYCYQAEAAGLIERSHAPHMSNLVVVRKRNFQFDPNNPLSGLRIVCDYRKLNISTEPSFVAQASPAICINALSNSQWYTVCDLTQSFHSLPITDPKVRDLTTFGTRFGNWRYKKVPQGIQQGPSALNSAVQLILAGLSWHLLVIYADDLIIFAEDFESLLQRTRVVFDRLCSANFKLSASKSFLFQQRVSYLGFIIDRGSVLVDGSKVDSIKLAPSPRTLKELRSWLGAAGYLKKICERLCNSC